MGTGSDNKVGLRTALHLGEIFGIRTTEDLFCPGAAKGVSVIRPLLETGDGQAQHDGQPDDGLGHMASAADDEPGRASEFLDEDPLIFQSQDAACTTSGQRREIPSQQPLRSCGPDGYAFTKKKPRSAFRPFQYGGQRMLPLCAAQSVQKLTNQHRISPLWFIAPPVWQHRSPHRSTETATPASPRAASASRARSLP